MKGTLTNHLKTVDDKHSMPFTHEESKGSLPLMDTLLVRKEDGSVKSLVHRKKTHTSQYLDFNLHHLLHQTMGVIRTLMDRCDKNLSEEAGREKKGKKPLQKY